MPRDASRQGAIAAASAVGLYLPLQPVLAWGARVAGLQGAHELDGLARWRSTLVVLLLGVGLASVLAADYRRRRGLGRMADWAKGAVSGTAVLTFLSALLTLTQAMLVWSAGHAIALALVVDAVAMAWVGSVALVAVTPRATPASSAASA